jgi:GntR family transcriptional regulator of vanillate catabolism
MDPMTMDELAPLHTAQRNRLVDEVVHRLRQHIVTGEIPGGTRLLQVDLANQLGVSRTPLREALRILEHDGLVSTSNNNRTVEVVTVDSAKLRDLYEVREVIDGLAARLAARSGLTEEAQAEAQRLLDEMAAASMPYDPARRTPAHAEFHALFVAHSGNDALQPLIPLIRLSSAALYFPFLNDPSAVRLVNAGKIRTHKDVLDETQQSHADILRSVIARQPAKAEAAARRHIRRTLTVVDELDDWRRIIMRAAEAEAAGPTAVPGARLARKKSGRSPR